jgi:hypothetical protein
MKNRYKVIGVVLIPLCVIMVLSCAKDDPTKPIQTIAFSSDLQTKDRSNGWFLAGPAVDSIKAMGKSNNQLYRSLFAPDNANKAKITINFLSDTMFSTNLTDVIWFKKKVEIKRSTKEIKGIPNKELVFDLDETRPPGADELLLIVRPWRNQDGIITITGGQLLWLK